MKEFINNYYRLFCSKYAENICRFVNGYNFGDAEGEFSYIYKYSEYDNPCFWKIDESSKFTISEIWTAIQDLFYIMGFDFIENFSKIIVPLCDGEAKDDTTKLAMKECESIIKYLVYDHFGLKENPHNGTLSIASTSYALSDFLKGYPKGYQFYRSIKILAAARNLSCHEAIPKPIDDSNAIRLVILQYIISVIVGIVAIFNKYKKDVRIFPPICEPLRVKIRTVASADIVITDVAWSQNDSDKKTIERIDGAEIREFEIGIQRHQPILFDIRYTHNGEVKTAAYSPSLDFSDNVDYVLEICIPEAKNNCRFWSVDRTITEDAMINVDSCENQQEIGDLGADVEDFILLVNQDVIRVEIETSNQGTYDVRYKLNIIEVIQQQVALNLYWQLSISRLDPDICYDITNIGQHDFDTAHRCVNELLGAKYDVKSEVLDRFEYNDIIENITVLSGEGGCETETLKVINNNDIELKVGTEEFKNNKKLKRVYLGNNTIISQEAFQNCSNLLAVYMKEGTEQRISHRAFKGCSALKSIVITENMGDEAFADCESLESVTFREMSKQITRIGKGTFMNCKSLKHISLPDYAEEIEARAFYGCGLKSVTIPQSVRVIHEEAFAECPFLREVYFDDISTIEEIHANAFKGCNLQFIYAGLNSVGIVQRLSIKDFYDKYAFKAESGAFEDIPKSRSLLSNLQGMFEKVFSTLDE